MDIGKEKERITVEPLEDPIPREQPAPTEAPEPKREPVPVETRSPSAPGRLEQVTEPAA